MDLELKNWLEEFAKDIMVGIDGINRRLDRVEARLDRVEARLDSLETRFDKLESSFKSFRSETRKNFREVNQRFDLVDRKLNCLQNKQEELLTNMNGRFAVLSTNIDKLTGKPPLTCNYTSPSVPELSGTREIRESAVPYLQHNATVISSAMNSSDDPDLDYLASLFSASDREFRDGILQNILYDIFELTPYVKRVDAHTPEQLKKREALLSALDEMFNRLASCFSDFPGATENSPTFLQYIQKNGFDSLMKIWNERIIIFKKMEAEALELIQQTVEYISPEKETPAEESSAANGTAANK